MAYECMTLCLSHSPGIARDEQKVHGTRFREGMRLAREAVREFDPTLVIFFGSDHRRAYQDILPAFSVVYAAEGLGDLRSPTGPYNVPEQIAADLTAALLNEGFDVAITRKIALDHGFGQTMADILGSLDAVPTVPIFINCATPPLASPRRAAELGAAVGRFAANLDERVLFIGSGGLSHSPPTLALTTAGLSEEERRELSAKHREAAKDKIRPDWDEAFLERLGAQDNSWAFAVTQEFIDPAGVGANEVRTWLAAYLAGGKPLRRVAYEPVREWITGMGVAMSDYSPAKAVRPAGVSH
ncbi:MAG: 3-carboxyethylcatechol 2,3-dioxygenase [Actinobacteria bacterium]|nr:MAG: 3-carboxyethylcatechol 2,3-dioxygenase [Actinomycetota bacterium]